jgi:hypothetical protein
MRENAARLLAANLLDYFLDYFPDGTRYVVEGKNNAKGMLKVSARYVVFPDGRRVDLPLKAVYATGLSPSETFDARHLQQDMLTLH